MMNTNMRRILKNPPTLRMMDGGSPNIFRSGNSFSDAANAPAGGAPISPGIYSSSTFNSAPAKVTPPGVSPMPGAQPSTQGATPGVSPVPVGTNPNAGKYGSAPTGAPVDQGAAMDRKLLATSAAAPAAERAPMQFKDGGEVSPWSLKGMYNAVSGPKETISQKYERQDAERAARQPKPQTPAAPAQGIGGYVGNSALQRREQAAGLRNGGDLKTGHGGHVPGTGTGDKIDALYEPGEFVVSNDMLDAEPGLREQLHSLRTEVLAEKGMTPEQADAKAMNGGTLRAQNAFGGMQMPDLDLGRFQVHPMPAASVAADTARRGRDPFASGTKLAEEMAAGRPQSAAAPTAPPPAPKYTPPPVNPTTGGYVQNEQISGRSAGGGQGVQGRSAGGSAGQAGPTVQMGSPATQPQNLGVGAGSSGRPGVLGSLRQGISNFGTGLGQQTNTGKLTYLAGSAMKPVAALANSTLGKAAGIASVVQNFNDYKLNDPDVDSSAGGSYKALLRDGDNKDFSYTETRKSLGKGLLETGMDLGSSAAKFADLAGYLPGVDHGFATKAYDGALRKHFGDQLVPHAKVNEAQGAAALQPSTANSAAAATPSTQGRTNLPAMDANMPGEDPNRITLRGRAGADVAGAPGVQKFTENGKTLYTNVAGDNKDMMDKKMVGIVPGMGKEAIDRTLNNPDGSRWSAGDNATLAANLRDGIDPYRGTSREAKASQSSQMSPLRARLEAMGGRKMSKTQAATLLSLREADQRHEAAMAGTAASVKNNETTNQTNLRGQDLDYEGKMAPIKQAARLREMNASIFKAAGGDNAKAAALAQAAGMPAKDFQDALAAQNASESATQATGTKARENAMKEFRVADRKDPSKWDEVASQQSYDAVRQIFPNIDSANEQDRGKAMPDAKAMANIFNRARTQDKVGWDAMKFWEAKRPVLNGMPNVSGTNASNVEQVGPFEGMVMLNGSNGDTILTQKDGRKLNLGKLDSREQKLLEDAQKKGWGN